MTMLCGVSYHHLCHQLLSSVSSVDGPLTVSSSVVTGGGRCCGWSTVDELGLFVDGDDGWIVSNQL